jgi:hypothetical protein
MNMTISIDREQGELHIVSLADDCMSHCLNNVLFISLARNAVCVMPDHFHNAFFFRGNPAYQAIFDSLCRELIKRDHWLNVRMFHLVNIYLCTENLEDDIAQHGLS